MRSDPETGCTCLDETTRRCPVHSTPTEVPLAPVVCASCGKDRELFRSGPGFAEYKRCKYCGRLAIIDADKWKPKTKRLNSLLPQVSNEVMDKLLKEVQGAGDDQDKLRAVFDERLELFRRENPALYSRLSHQTSPDQMGWIVYVYRALAEQNQKDMRYPA